MCKKNMTKAIKIIKDAQKSNRRIRIVIQKSGKLFEASREFLRASGINLPQNLGRNLVCYPAGFPNLEIALVRQGDIPWYLENGNADYGIIGEDQLAEKVSTLPVMAKLGVGRCTLSIAVRNDSRINSPGDLNGITVATSFPLILSQYLRANSITPKKIIELSGSVEATAVLGIADAICDLVETGETLKANGLRLAFPIFESEAVLAGGLVLQKRYPSRISRVSAFKSI
jgi:ATP phosphoribosyltransferase